MADPVHSKSSDEDDIIWDEYSDSKNVVSKKKPRTETDSYLVAHVTSSNLNLDNMCLSKVFSRSNGLNKRRCEIDLMNRHGKSWTLRLRFNNKTGQACISGGWRDFCLSNGLEAEYFYKFKLVRNGTRPLLQLCSDTTLEGNCSKAKRSSEYSESELPKQNNFLTLTLKPYMVNSGQLRLPGSFARENGINKAGEIILMDKNGVKWPSNLVSIEQGNRFYMTKGWRSFCAANELKEGETFTLEFIRGQSTTTPMLKFCSKAKVKIEQALFDDSGEACKASGVEEETEIRVEKRARVFAEGGPSHRTLGSNSPDLQHKQPIQPCSISDQVTKVKQSIMDVLTCVRRFRSELEIKEHNLEASLLEIDVLGKKVLEINKILK